MRRATGAALVCVAAGAGLAGCGGRSESSQVKAKVMQFATAVHKRDYATICHQVLSPQLVADTATVGCERALALGLRGVKGASLFPGKVTVSGRHASVQTLSQARGEKTVLATLELVKTSAGWRISSLGDAAQPAA